MPEAPHEALCGSASASGYSIKFAPTPDRKLSQRKILLKRCLTLGGLTAITGIKSNVAEMKPRKLFARCPGSAWVKAEVTMPQGRSWESQSHSSSPGEREIRAKTARLSREKIARAVPRGPKPAGRRVMRPDKLSP